MKSVNGYAALRAVVGAIGISALLFGATAVPADVVMTGQPPAKGTLFLEKTGFGKLQFRYDSVDQSVDVIQSIVDKSWITWKITDLCTLVLSPATAPGVGLVTLSAGAGFLFDHIGVKGSGLCSEISGSEALTIALGGQLDGFQVYHTELNLEMKSKAVARIDTTANGQTQTFVIQSPGSTIPPTAVLPAGATVIACAFQSGLDEKDICRWNSDALWTSATIKALAGQVVVEGGTGGGSGGLPSKFSITKIDGTLDCGDHRNTLTATDTGSAAAAVGTRLTNTDGGTCTPIPYALSWTDTDSGPVLQYFKDDLGQAVATTFTIVWPNEPAPDVTDNVLGSIPLSQQEFVVGQPLPIDLCVGTPHYVPGTVPDPDHPGQFLPVLDSLTPPDGGFPDLVPGGTTQYGCVYDRRITLPAAGTIGLKELIFLEGDWGASRAF
jgi:hypothetical protein